MTREELYEIWAPPDAVWSPWVKPVLFATLSFGAPDSRDASAPTVVDMKWAPTGHERTAIVIDLPGTASVSIGLALAKRGYRPVPLYNTTFGPRPAIDMEEIAADIVDGAAVLTQLTLPPDAPPAFLLDSRRQTGERRPGPGDYDNRWIVFPQDFPSARFLTAQGIQKVLLVAARCPPAEDLAHVLLRWQDAGLSIWFDNPAETTRAEPLTVTRPPHYRSLWYRALVLLGLRRSSAGGFGGFVPEPSSGGFG